MYSIGPSSNDSRVVKAHWISPEMEAYNQIYWDFWEEGYRGTQLRRKVAERYRSIYGN